MDILKNQSRSTAISHSRFARPWAPTFGSLSTYAVLILALVSRMPISDRMDFGLLILAIVLWVHSAPRSFQPKRHFMLLAVLSGILVLMTSLLPNPRIQEGNNLFLLDNEQDPFNDKIPLPVFDYLRAEFEKAYPPENWCDRGTMWCWRTHGIPSRPYAFSSESIWQRNVRYSRLVDHIRFSNVGELKTGWVNDWNSCFFDQISDVKRDHLPFFVRWDLSEAMVGGKIQWSGDLLVGSTTSGYSHEHGIMREMHITPAHSGTEVWGFRIDPESSLSMNWIPPGWWKTTVLLRFMIPWCSVFTLLFSLRAIQYRKAIMSLQLVAIAMGVIVWINRDFVFFHPPLFAGHDGLWMEGFGFQGTQHLSNGNITEFLRGGENAFWLMPLLRYFRTIEDLLFGDTNFLIVAIASSIPVVAFLCLTRFTNKKAAFLLSICCCFIPWNLGFIRWAELSIRGLAEPIALACFLPALLKLFSPEKPGKTGVFTMLLLAMTCGLRPNFLPPVIILLAFLVWNEFRASGRFRYGLILWFCSLVALIPLHNLVFSGKFVLFTTGANTVKSLPWEFWTHALKDVVRLDWDAYHLQATIAHLKIWIFSSAGFSETLLPSGRVQEILGYGNILALAATAYTTLRCEDLRLKHLSWIALAAHAAGLLYHPSGRYIYLAWDLSHALLVLRLLPIFQKIRIPTGFSRTTSVSFLLMTGFAIGAAASVFLPGFPARIAFEIEFRMIADHPSMVALYFDSGKGFNENERVLSAYKANTVQLHHIQSQTQPTRLRLDPSSHPNGFFKILGIRYRFKGGLWKEMPLDNLFPRKDLREGGHPGEYNVAGDDSILYFHETPQPSSADRFVLGYLFYLFSGGFAAALVLLLNSKLLSKSRDTSEP